MIILQSDIEKTLIKLADLKADLSRDDYILVTHTDTRFVEVACPIPIVTSKICPTGAFYIIKRKDFEENGGKYAR